MDLIGRFMIIPLSILSMLTGLILAFWTQWGLIRYYWVFVKFVLGIFASIGLILHQFVAIGEAARKVALISDFPDPGRLGPQLIIDASLAILVLLAATVLSMYKPWGLTAYGLWKQKSQKNPELSTIRSGDKADMIGFGLKISIALVAVLIIAVAIVHLSSRGFGTHQF
ncbi:hypothetical protein LEP1GSC058_1919 [Leptospira fainei serovar Hurstbridge str. BUT 6]|uniref:Uncharacterized protein n=2 Tax=Leptospira fainei TaxID=48782 RepID=S3UYU1_9LEPT|nr:hypothetical protein LEP1GSC058_1919 [Leptospira fainei serovar Hurstbridge str. BUT 6]